MSWMILEQKSAIFGLSSSRPIRSGGRFDVERDHGAMPRGTGPLCRRPLESVSSIGPGSLAMCMAGRKRKIPIPFLQVAVQKWATGILADCLILNAIHQAGEVGTLAK